MEPPRPSELSVFTRGVGTQVALFFFAILPRAEFGLSQTPSLGSIVAAMFGYLFSILCKDFQTDREWEGSTEHEDM